MPESRRSFAEIEADLQEAQACFTDADRRSKAALHERATALDRINRHQSEFDAALAQVRSSSIPGTKWRGDVMELGDNLMEERETVRADSSSGACLGTKPEPALRLLAPRERPSSLDSATQYFDHLRSAVEGTAREIIS